MKTCSFRRWKLQNIIFAIGIFLNTHLLSFGLEPSWIKFPENSSSREGQSVTLQCRVKHRGSRAVAWFKYSGDIVYHLFIDSNPWIDDKRLQITEFDNGYDLTIRNITKSDDGEYECVLARSDIRQKAYLTVLVSPTKPELISNGSEILRERNVLKLNCTTSNGNPPPQITWLRNGVELTKTNYRKPKEKFGLTSSSIIHDLDHSDHLANYSCVVNHETDGVRRNKIISKILTVHYAPIISLGEYNPFKVIENSELTLKCDVEAYPPVEEKAVFWTKDIEIESEGSVLNVFSIKKKDAGVYSCSASNVVGNTIADLQVDVLYTPIVKILSEGYQIPNSTMSIKEGQGLYLTCEVDSNPIINGFAKWHYKGEKLDFTSKHFVLESISRSQKGTYTCEVENILKPSGQQQVITTASASVGVNIYYKPGIATIEGPLYALIGSSVTLTCLVDNQGIPKGQIVWSKLQSSNNFESSDTLVLYNVDSTDGGEYKCMSKNAVGDGTSASFILNIYEAPVWVPGGKLISVRSVMITQTNIFAICTVRGRPLPKITWLKNGTEIYNDKLLYEIQEEHRTIDSKSFILSSTLFWRGASRYPRSDKLHYEDSGFYTCIADNEVSTNNISSTVNMIIQYPPVLNTNRSQIAVDIGHEARLVCEAHCFPECFFTWYNETNKIMPTSRIYIDSVNINSNDFPYQSILSIAKVHHYDLKPYMCLVSNKMGSDSFDLRLIPKTTPEKPKNLKILMRTWESVSLQWDPGFDGGHKQWFSITYYYDDRSSRLIRLKPETNTFNVTDLLPGTNYTFIIFSSNLLGPGKSSEKIHAFTKAYAMDSPREVYYHKDEKTLTFQSHGTHFCVHVETYNNGGWYLYEKCAPASGGSIKIHERLIENVRVALCQINRKEICSHFVEAFIVNTPPNDVGMLTILIVAGACSIVVFILVIILIVVCHKRRKVKKKSNKELRTNNVMPQINRQEFERQNPPGSLFVYDLKNIDGKYPFENRYKNAQNPWLKEYPPPYNDIEKKMNVSFHNNSIGENMIGDLPLQRGSNMSTPEIKRPRKVVYEVVV